MKDLLYVTYVNDVDIETRQCFYNVDTFKITNEIWKSTKILITFDTQESIIIRNVIQVENVP